MFREVLSLQSYMLCDWNHGGCPVPGWKVLNLKPLTDSTICSPHTECNHTKLQSASDCRSFRLCHKLVLWKMSKTQRWKPVLVHTQPYRQICVIQRHTVIKSKHPCAYAIWQSQIYCWLWGWILPWESKSHFLICVCKSDWSKMNIWRIENCAKNETCSDNL